MLLIEEPTFPAGKGKTQQILSTVIKSPILQFVASRKEEIWGAIGPYSTCFLFLFYEQFWTTEFTKYVDLHYEVCNPYARLNMLYNLLYSIPCQKFQGMGSNSVLWFKPRQQLSTLPLLNQSSHPQWAAEENWKKGKTHGLR